MAPEKNGLAGASYVPLPSEYSRGPDHDPLTAEEREELRRLRGAMCDAHMAEDAAGHAGNELLAEPETLAHIQAAFAFANECHYKLDRLLAASERRERESADTLEACAAFLLNHPELFDGTGSAEYAVECMRDLATGEARSTHDAAIARAETAERALAEAREREDATRALLWRLATWTHQMGSALKPQLADTYGEGMRDAKGQVARMLATRPPGTAYDSTALASPDAGKGE